ncbi:MAG: methyltransferase domain-containing protein [Pseudomonadota bacterium]
MSIERFESVPKNNFTNEEFVERIRHLTTWPVRMLLPMPEGDKWVDTGGGVDKLLAGDDNVRIVDKPQHPLGMKPYWHLNPIIDLFGTLKKKRVLDIGCGVGYVSALAARKGATVVATEMHDQNIERAKIVLDSFKLNSSSSVVKSDMQTMTHEEMGTFDVVLFLGTIYHCEHPQDVLERVSKMSDIMVIDGRMATDEQVNERIGDLEFFVDEYDDQTQYSSIRRVGGGILRKPTRKTLWKMLKNVGYNSIHQTMPYDGMASQFQTEGFLQFVAKKRANLRDFSEV